MRGEHVDLPGFFEVAGALQELLKLWGLSGLLTVPLFRGSSGFESLLLSHHSRLNVTCECSQQEINDDDNLGFGGNDTCPASQMRCAIFISQKVCIKSSCKSQFPHKSVNLFFVPV